MHLRVNCKKHWSDNAPVTWDGRCYQCLLEVECNQEKERVMPRQIEDYFVDIIGSNKRFGIRLGVSSSDSSAEVTLTMSEAAAIADQLMQAIENIRDDHPYRFRIHVEEGLLED